MTHMLLNELGAYGSIWLEIVQMYGKKVVTRYVHVNSNTEWGGGGEITPMALSKVGRYVNE